MNTHSNRIHDNRQSDPLTSLTIKQREDLSKYKLGHLELDRQLLAKR